jgi:glycosyltransferase involved in cell wall biosynthesis
VSDFFDERPLNVPESWQYPSPLGANSSMRRSALVAIGGFDETFAYYLDETDVCLRLVDAGWKVVYEPNALVWHRCASSMLRTAAATPLAIESIVRSHSYFIHRHGLSPWSAERLKAAANRIEALRAQWLAGNAAARRSGSIDDRDKARLDAEVERGLRDGAEAALSPARLATELDAPRPAFAPFLRDQARLTVAFVSRGFPPHDETGIATWTSTIAYGLAARGHAVHVVTEAQDEERLTFSKGVWVHEIANGEVDAGTLVTRFDLPADLAGWMENVRRRVQLIKSFDLDVLSFPIWDLEGMGCLGDADVAVSMSLHTTYALAHPFKPEWSLRPILADTVVRRMIAAEKIALARADMLLANTNAIVTDIEGAYGLDLGGRVRVAPHGVPAGSAPSAPPASGSLKVLFVGRIEPRKGFDLALASILKALGSGASLEATFVGGQLNRAASGFVPPNLLDAAFAESRIRFGGVVSRDELDGLYRACDVVLMPSRYESFGLVAIEAFARERPVIALAVGGLKEVVADGETGWLVDPDDDPVRAIANHLVAIAANKKLATLAGTKAAEAHRARFSVDAMAEHVEAAFMHLVETRTKG